MSIGSGTLPGRALALAATLCLGVADPAGAGVRVMYRSGNAGLFSFEAPDGWGLRTGVEATPEDMPDRARPMARVISLMPVDEDAAMWVGLWSPPHLRSVEDGVEYFADLKLDLLEDPIVRETVARSVGGMEAVVHHGTGRRAGRSFEFSVALVQLTPERVAIAAFIGEPAAQARHREELRALLGSMRRAGETGP